MEPEKVTDQTITIEQVLDFYNDDCDDHERVGRAVTTVETNEYVDGKVIITTTILHNKETGQFYRVSQCRDNQGYWGDGETYDAEIEEVWQIPVASWEYVNKKPEGA